MVKTFDFLTFLIRNRTFDEEKDPMANHEVFLIVSILT